MSGPPSSVVPIPYSLFPVPCRLPDLLQQLLVRLRVGHLAQEELSGLGARERVEGPAELVDLVELFGGEEQLLASGGAALDVDCGEDAALGDLAVEHDLGVPGSLELLEDDLVAAAARLGEGGSDDRQASAAGAIGDVAGGTEEPLRLLERTAVDAAGESASGATLRGVVGAGEPGQRIENEDHVTTPLDLPSRHLEGHLGDRHVSLRWEVEGRGDDLTVTDHLHLGHFFR